MDCPPSNIDQREFLTCLFSAAWAALSFIVSRTTDKGTPILFKYQEGFAHPIQSNVVALRHNDYDVEPKSPLEAFEFGEVVWRTSQYGELEGGERLYLDSSSVSRSLWREVSVAECSTDSAGLKAIYRFLSGKLQEDTPAISWNLYLLVAAILRDSQERACAKFKDMDGDDEDDEYDDDKEEERNERLNKLADFVRDHIALPRLAKSFRPQTKCPPPQGRFLIDKMCHVVAYEPKKLTHVEHLKTAEHIVKHASASVAVRSKVHARV